MSFVPLRPPQWACDLRSQIEKILALLCQIQTNQEKIMALVTVDTTQVDAINAALTTLTTDTTTALADIAAKIAALQSNTPDPNTATELGNILTGVNTLTTNITAADPGPITPAGGSAPVGSTASSQAKK